MGNFEDYYAIWSANDSILDRTEIPRPKILYIYLNYMIIVVKKIVTRAARGVG